MRDSDIDTLSADGAQEPQLKLYEWTPPQPRRFAGLTFSDATLLVAGAFGIVVAISWLLR